MVRRPTSIFSDRKFLGLLLLVILILLIGMFFYGTVEHWSRLDSIYFSIVTLTTVGFGDFSPQTDSGKVFTIFYLLIGIGILLALIAVIADHAMKNYYRLTETYLARPEKKNNEE